jgi:hypothetical protein
MAAKRWHVGIWAVYATDVPPLILRAWGRDDLGNGHARLLSPAAPPTLGGGHDATQLYEQRPPGLVVVQRLCAQLRLQMLPEGHRRQRSIVESPQQ